MMIQQFSSSDSSVLDDQQHDTASDDRARVLLVENDPDDARRLRRAFEDISTETVVDVVGDGEQALSLLHGRLEEPKPVPDLVLLDLDLPDADGFEFLETVRETDELVHIPILVLGRADEDTTVHESYDRAANAYLSKPSDPDAFEAVASAIECFWFRRVSLPPVHP